MIKQKVTLTYKTQFNTLTEANTHIRNSKHPNRKDFEDIFDWVSYEEQQTLYEILQDGDLERIKTKYIEDKCPTCGK